MPPLGTVIPCARAPLLATLQLPRMPVKFRVTEHNNFIKYHLDFGVQVALNIAQMSRGCSYTPKLCLSSPIS